jgi:hypothetical protein
MKKACLIVFKMKQNKTGEELRVLIYVYMARILTMLFLQVFFRFLNDAL